jgi:DNA repair protein RadC
MFDSNKIKIGSEITFQNWSGEKRIGKVTRFIDGGSYEVQTKFATVMVDPDEIVGVEQYADGGTIDVSKINVGSEILFVAGMSDAQREGVVASIISPGMYEVSSGFGKVLVDSDEIVSVKKYAKGGAVDELLKVGSVIYNQYDKEWTIVKLDENLIFVKQIGTDERFLKKLDKKETIENIKNKIYSFERKYPKSKQTLKVGDKVVGIGKYDDWDDFIFYDKDDLPTNMDTEWLIRFKKGIIKNIDGNQYTIDFDGDLETFSKPRLDTYFTKVKKFAEGGSVEMQNYEMVKNNNKAIAHHSKELDSVLVKNKKVPAWVVAKVYKASNDLSDITHYLDGAKFEYGGKLSEYGGTQYLSWDFDNKGNKWNVLVAWGRNNYLSVLKKTNNPFGGRIGTEYKSVDEALAKYKDPTIQANILFAIKEAEKYGKPKQWKQGGYVGTTKSESKSEKSTQDEYFVSIHFRGSDWSNTGTKRYKVLANSKEEAEQISMDKFKKIKANASRKVYALDSINMTESFKSNPNPTKNSLPERKYAEGGTTNPGNILKNNQYKLKSFLKAQPVSASVDKYKEFDGENTISINYLLKDESKVENILNEWVKSIKWKYPVTIYKSVDDFSDYEDGNGWTYIIEESLDSKYAEGGTTNDLKVVKVGNLYKIKSASYTEKTGNKFYQKISKNNKYIDLTFATKKEAQAFASKNPTFGKGGSVQYKDLSQQKDMVINESKNKFSEKKNDVPEVEMVFKKAEEFESYPVITSSKSAIDVFRKFWDTQRLPIQESFYVMFLNTANKPISIYNPFKGGISSTVADVEIITAAAIKSLARGVIICHNHPSGQLKFSQADINLTRNLSNALKIVTITLLDSMVITENSYISMADEGIDFTPTT